MAGDTPEINTATDIEAKSGDKSVRLRTYRLVDLAVGYLMVVTAVLFWIVVEHKIDTKEASAANIQQRKEAANIISAAIKEQASAMKDQTKALQFQACLFATSPERREKEYMSENSFCRQITK